MSSSHLPLQVILPPAWAQHYGWNVCDTAKDAVLTLKLYTFLKIKSISSVKFFFLRLYSEHSSTVIYISSVALFDLPDNSLYWTYFIMCWYLRFQHWWKRYTLKAFDVSFLCVVNGFCVTCSAQFLPCDLWDGIKNVPKFPISCCSVQHASGSLLKQTKFFL